MSTPIDPETLFNLLERNNQAAHPGGGHGDKWTNETEYESWYQTTARRGGPAWGWPLAAEVTGWSDDLRAACGCPS